MEPKVNKQTSSRAPAAAKWSVVLSEIPLVLSVLHTLRQVPVGDVLLVQVGLLVIGTASFLGILRFAGVKAVLSVHREFSDAGGAIGFPLIALFLEEAARHTLARYGMHTVHILGTVVGAYGLVRLAAPKAASQGYNTLIALASLATIGYYGGSAGVAVAALVAVGFVLMEAKACIKPILEPEDFFHYLLAAAVWCLSFAIMGREIKLPF